ncbi:MAG: GEVED domain-containing protein, partial [Bacteroidia bacterium]|nr:GEVED domain-containing protein [Bacteroidia bacterium]
MITALTTTRASFLTPDNGGTNDALTPVAAPTADFSVSGQVLCGLGQTISLLDKSNCVANSYITASLYPNVTYSWTISNGSTTYTSSVQNPTITIANAGTYSVTLAVTNALGTNSVTKPNAIVVPASGPVSACVPSSANSGNTGQTITDVQFNNINAPSATIGSAAYTDLSCTQNTTVTAGSSYPLKITALGLSYAEYFEVYIDYNNNGIFTNPGELVFSGSSPVTALNTYTTSVAIPTTAVQNTLLRMRVMGEANAAPTAAKRSCSSSFFVGDVEDYGVYIKPVACSAPSITATSGASRCGTGT